MSKLSEEMIRYGLVDEEWLARLRALEAVYEAAVAFEKADSEVDTWVDPDDQDDLWRRRADALDELSHAVRAAKESSQ